MSLFISLIIVLVIMAVIFLFLYPIFRNFSIKRNQPPQYYKIFNQESNTNLYDGYTSKWMFSLHEKDAFYKIKSVTDKFGLYLFAKVRLFDLIEPKNRYDKDKTLQWKIQAKHVDFVICDQKLIARVIIELDDSSHEKYKRQERDEFVDFSLIACGYKVLRYKSINPEILESELSIYKPTTTTV